MADKKYGQLFTIQDVVNIVTLATGEPEEAPTRTKNALMQMSRRGVKLRFPADEPLFVLRAQDQAAPQAIQAYHDSAEFNGASQEHLSDVMAALIEFVGFQSGHPDRVKIPD